VNTTTKIALALGIALALAGCVGLGGDDADTASEDQGVEGVDVGEQTEENIQERTQDEPTNYTVPSQDPLATTTEIYEETVGPEANAAVECKNDRCGNNVNTYRQVQDVSQHVPTGQATEIDIKLHYQGGPASSADLDIYVNVPGYETEYAPDNNDEFNWKLSVQTLTVNTVGVSGQPAEIGVQVTNGKVVEPMDYTLNVTFRYADNVVTPYHPYAIQVPENATGLIFESEKTGGGEHIKSEFLVIGPDDNLVRHVSYNDLVIASESVIVPVSQPGEYVFYAPKMRGGFLSVTADAPPQERPMETLERELQRTVDLSGPAPGSIEWSPTEGCSVSFVGSCETGATTPMSGGQETTFTIEDSFPLEVDSFVGPADGERVTASSQVKISSEEGLVHAYKRIVRAGQGDDTVGMSRDEINTAFYPGNLTRSQYTLQIVNNGPNEVGHTVLTYQR
jgi:hypothetical protein